MLLNLQGFARCFIGSTSAPAAVSLPDNDDLLREILLRVPPQPSSLPRVSLVCKRWRRLVSDPGFLRRYQEHHRTPPLLGYFFTGTHVPVFTPTLAPPNRISPARFSLPQQPAAGGGGGGDRLFLLGCRHGLVLLINRRRLEAIVWDPVARRQATVAYPEEFTTDNGDHCCRGAVLSGEEGGGGLVPGEDGQLRPFKVILIRTVISEDLASVFMCVYESKTGKWGNAISTTIPSLFCNLPNVLVGNQVLCGFFRWPDGFLEFDLDRQSLSVIQTPNSFQSIESSTFQAVRTQDAGLGVAILSRLSIQLWGRKVDYSGGGIGWVLQKTIQVDKLLSLPPSMDNNMSARILGYDENSNAIHLSSLHGAFAIQLGSIQLTELFNVNQIGSYYPCHPYTSFYTAGFGESVREIIGKKY